MSDLYVKLTFDESVGLASGSMNEQVYSGITFYAFYDEQIEFGTFNQTVVGTWEVTLNDPNTYPGDQEVPSGVFLNPVDIDIQVAFEGLVESGIVESGIVTEITADKSQTTTIAPTETSGIGDTVFLYPEYVWETIDVPSFFSINDTGNFDFTVTDFNNLDGNQVYAIKRGDSIYDVGYSDDNVVDLPTIANAKDLGGTGVTYNFNNALTVGDGLFILNGSDGPINLAINNSYNASTGLGGADYIYYENDNITITSSGSSNAVILAGSGTSETGGTIEISANGLVFVDGGVTLAGTGTVRGNIGNSGTIEATGGLLTLNGPVSGTGVLEIAAGATLEITGSLSITDTDSFLGDGVLQLDSPTADDDTLEVGDGGTLDLQAGVGNTETITFDGAGTLDIGDPPTPEGITVVGFQKGDTIDFVGQKDLTLGYAFQNSFQTNPPAIAYVYSGNTIVAQINLGSASLVSSLGPLDDGSAHPGTMIVVDPGSINSTISNPDSDIDWAFIQSNEGGIWYSPYVIPGSDTSGITIGMGVDLGNGPLSDEDTIQNALPNWQTNPNLRALIAGAIPSTETEYGGLLGTQGPTENLQYLALAAPAPGDPGGSVQSVVATSQPAPWQTPGTGGNPTLVSLSLTIGQADTLTGLAEQKMYSALATAYGKTAFSSLEPGEKTALMDMDYNFGLSKLESYTFWKQAIADSQNGWNQAYLNLITWGGPASLYARRIADAAQLYPYVSSPLAPPAALPYTINSKGWIIFTNTPVQGQVLNQADPAGSQTYTFTEDSGSPVFSSIVLPATDASEYAVSWEADGAWTSPQIAQPEETLAAPLDADAIQVILLDAEGNPVSGPTNFSFYVTFASDGSLSGTIVEPEVSCFVTGTCIATYNGNVPVETLRIGTQVRLANSTGLSRPIRWIGHRTVECSQHPKPEAVRPVRVAAHVFGRGRPERALWLSPDHAVFVEGVLIPIKYLINGTTIRQVARAQVTYWHVELDTHDLLLAEGMPCESYLDTGNRNSFKNGGLPLRLHPEFATRAWESAGCAPLVVTGPEVERVRALIATRQARSGRRRPRRRAA